MRSPEISDLVVSFDSQGARRAVRKEEVVESFRSLGNAAAAEIVAAIPANDGVLDESAVDALLLRSHAELQRLSEEFQQGPRVKRVLCPLLRAVRASGHHGPIRVVDVGCGLGYVVRWLALHGELGNDVELIGADFNQTLVRAAERARVADGAACRFVVADAFALDEPATVFTSTGVIHHFRGARLEQFFRAQARSPALAFAHFDIKPTWLSPLGAFIFHRARMRQPLSRHDGVLSARRAHSGTELLAAAERGASGSAMSFALYDSKHSRLPILRVLHAIVGTRTLLWPEFEQCLGDAAGRLGARECSV